MPLNLFNEWLTNNYVKAFSWTLIHSLWQGFAAAIIAGIIIVLTQRSKAVLRYNLLSATLILFLFVTAITFIWHYQSYQTSSLPSISSTVITEIKDADVSVYANRGEETIYSTLADAFVPLYEQHAPLITLIWCILFLFQSLKLVGGFYYIHTIRSRKISPVPLEWIELLHSLCKRLNIKQSVLFHQSEKVNVPVVLGYLKPTILVPLGMLANLPPEQVETILLHELAHIKRRDYVFNLFQSFAEAIFFFNPAVKWISSLIREEREACCDDLVMEHAIDKTTYLQALVTFHHQVLQSQNYAMALGGNNSSLLNRIKRMLTYENNKLNIMEKILLFSGVILFTTFGIINAQNKIQQKAPPPPASYIKEPGLPPEPSLPPQPVIPPVPTVNVNKVQPVVPVEEKLVAPAIIKDTVPKSGYTSIINNINTSGTNKTAEYVLKHENGTAYRLRKVNGVLSDFYVNDVRIADSELPAYKNVLDELDQVIQRDEELAAQRREEARIKREEAKKMREDAKIKSEEAKKMREEMQVQRKEDIDRRKLDQKENIKIQREKINAHQEKMDVQRKQHADREVELKQRTKELRKTSQSKNEANFIIEELLKEGVIKDQKKLDFTLDYNSLSVNGSKQSVELHKRLKEKYINKEGDYIKYTKDAYNTIISITRN